MQEAKSWKKSIRKRLRRNGDQISIRKHKGTFCSSGKVRELF